ncbi:unnamed protein product [Hydatigera taeniaeformis]|uniref:ZM domain-containing protein n=1 Tax=Hydatigena taeniaeformis TaxID=6205 RepID=A0A0R3X2X2_HYDTA|nr:unnamed protein product [Hydatigera taeniaeformis]
MATRDPVIVNVDKTQAFTHAHHILSQPIFPTKKEEVLSNDIPVNRRVPNIAQSWTEGSKIVLPSLSEYSTCVVADSYARKTQERETDQGDERDKCAGLNSAQRMDQTPPFDVQLTPPRHYLPVGGIDIYTTQGPNLMREMKDRFRKKYSASYVELEPKHQPQPLLQSDRSAFPTIEKSPNAVQDLSPVPTNFSNDLSHILPSVLKERPKRAGRLPSRYASQLFPADNVCLAFKMPCRDTKKSN